MSVLPLEPYHVESIETLKLFNSKGEVRTITDHTACYPPVSQIIKTLDRKIHSMVTAVAVQRLKSVIYQTTLNALDPTPASPLPSNVVVPSSGTASGVTLAESKPVWRAIVGESPRMAGRFGLKIRSQIFGRKFEV